MKRTKNSSNKIRRQKKFFSSSFKDRLKNNRLLIKISKWVVLSLLIIGAIVSMVFGSLNVSKSEDKDNAQFGDTYNVRFNVSLKINEPANITDSDKQKINYNDLLINGDDALSNEAKVIKTANAFQLWMYENNIYNTGVQYSMNTDYAAIETNVYNIQKINWNSDYSTESDKSQYLSKVLFDNMNNNYISIVKYNKSSYIQGAGIGTNTSENYIYGKESYANGQKILTSNGFDFSTSKAYDREDFTKDETDKQQDDTEGVTVRTIDKLNIDLSDFIAIKNWEIENASSSDSSGTTTTYDSSDTTNTDIITASPKDDYKWYIFKDLDKLVKRLNFIQLVCIWNRALTLDRNNWISLYNNLINENILPNILSFPNLTLDEKVNYLQKDIYPSLLPEEKQWGDAVANKVIPDDINDIGDTFIWINDTNILDFYNQIKTPLSSLNGNTNGIDFTKKQSDGYYNSNLANIVSPYIIETITYDNYTEFFPKAKKIDDQHKDPNQIGEQETSLFRFPRTLSLFSSINTKDSAKDSSIIHFLKNNISNNTISNEQEYSLDSYPSNNGGTVYSIVNKQIKKDYKELFDSRNVSSTKDSWKELKHLFDTSSYLGGTVLKNSITTLNSYNSMFLASGIVLFIVAIIVSVLYRVPGIFGSFAIILSSVIALSFNFLIKLTFSFGTLLAIFMGVLLTLSSIVLLLERVRKNIKENVSIFDSVDNSWKKTISSILDIHIISILAGLAFSFFGKLEIVDFGFQLILSSLVSLLVVFVYFVMYFVNLIKEPVFWNNKLLYSKVSYTGKSNNFVNKVTSKFNWKVYMIVSIISLLIFAIIVTLTFTIGVPNSSVYNEGTTLYIYNNLSSDEIKHLKDSLGISWTLISTNESYTVFQSSWVISSNNIVNKIGQSWLDDHGVLGQDIIIGRSVIDTPLLIASDNMCALLIGSGFILAYSLIRFTIFGLIPIFVGTILPLLTAMSFNYILYINIDSYFTYVNAFVFVISNMVCFSYLSTIKSRFNKKAIYTNEDISNFFSNNIKYLKNYTYVLLLTMVVMSSMFMIFMSVSLVWTFASMLLTSIICIALTIFITTILYYGFLILRQKYVKNIVHDVITNRSSKYDAVDEELVLNINSFE